jgi:probable phosphoglycerate mutase
VSRRLIVEADGGSRGNPGPAAYGSVVREAATGDVLIELAGHLGVATNNVAEYTGLLEGLKAAAEIDPTALVEARLDSKLVVEQMSGRWAIKNDVLRRIALEARDVLPREQVSYTWVPREKNAAADKLANESMDAVEKGRSGTIRRSRSDAFEVETQADVLPDTPTPAIPGWGPDLGAPTVTILVRHGVTPHSVERRFSGSGGAHDPGLTDLGREQIATAGRELKRRGGGDVLVCSPMLRTCESATIIGEIIGLEPVVVEGLQEAKFGEWDGHTFAEVMERWPAQMSGWLGSPEIAPPGGESIHQVYDRIGMALDTIQATYPGKRIIVACHVGTIRSLTVRALGAPLSSVNKLEIAPASLTTLTWYADGNSSLRSFAEAAHLDELQQTQVP